MHDANGTSLRVGDKVMILATITELQPTAEFCNVTVESIHTRKPDNARERMTLNTAVLVKVQNAVMVR